MTKRSIHQEDIIIINIYALNLRAPKYRKQTLTELKGGIDSSMITVGDLDTPFSIMDRQPDRRLIRK